MFGIQSVFLAALSFFSPPSADTPISDRRPSVHVPYGTYQGYYNASTDIDVWRSIRYAAPATGQNRWRPPQPPTYDLSGEMIDARDWPKQCPASMPGDMEHDTYNPLQTTDDEDCLFLSVYKPREAANLPVYVWFHGGGLAFNSAREFDGQPMVGLSNNSIIAITVQYRLGLFGFLASPEMGDGLNAGLKDALGSLQWVQDYIHLFGGDPNRVTIGGESAGASFVYTMLAGQAGASKPLFHAAFASSGGGPGTNCDKAEHKATWEIVSWAAGCYDDLACLRNVSSTRLRVLNGLYGAKGTCVEGPDGYVKRPVVPQLASGDVAAVPIMAGNTINDAYGGTPSMLRPSPDSPTYEQDADALFLGYITKRYPIDPTDSKTLGSILRLYPLKHFENDNIWRLSQCAQDLGVACSATYAVQAAARKNVAGYKYLYAVPPGWHAQDNAQEYPWFYYKKEGSTDSPSLFASFTGSLISLVKTGDPTAVANLRPADDPAWPTWAPEQQYKVFNVTAANISDAYITRPGDKWEHRVGTKARCDFWAELRTKGQW